MIKKTTFLKTSSLQKPFVAGCTPSQKNLPFLKNSLYKKSSAPQVPAWQDVVHMILEKKLTSQQLAAYVHARIDARIAHWKNKYQEWQVRWHHVLGKNRMTAQAYNELCEIPLYVIHNPHLTHEDFLDAVFVFSDEKGKQFYCEKQGRSEHKWQDMLDHSNGKMAHGRLNALYIQEYIQNPAGKSDEYITNFPYYVLATIEHEITHCEQAANGRALVQLTGMHTRTIILMTNKGAHESMRRFNANNLKQLRSSNSFSMESEADNRSVEFHPNMWGLRAICTEHKKRGFESDTREGYFSNDRCIALATALLSERPHDRFEYYDCMVKSHEVAQSPDVITYDAAVRVAQS